MGWIRKRETRGAEAGTWQRRGRQFYRQLAAPVLIGMKATCNSQRFIELVEDLGHVICIGDAAQIRASHVRKQTTDTAERGRARENNYQPR